jgi:hypothetical protein
MEDQNDPGMRCVRPYFASPAAGASKDVLTIVRTTS